ncbi:hypothetical protein BaRGS_00024170 [Batillaria attramentaria]|uniref:Uncharacterized protein n=1 Tax=Batillaria attramentaria TaxID=370345 RepID=A0ABD0KBQ9_9CAEN
MSTLEERVHSLPDVSPEDAKAACALVQQHPDLNEAFNSLVDLVLLLHDNKPKEFIQQFARLKENLPFGNDTFGHIGTFLALIGGVKLMVKVYTDLLQQRGWDHVTEERLYSGQDGGGDEVDGRGDNSDIGQMRKSMLGLTDTSEQFACRLAESGLFQHLVDEVKSMHNCSFQVRVVT